MTKKDGFKCIINECLYEEREVSLNYIIIQFWKMRQRNNIYVYQSQCENTRYILWKT